MDTSVSSIQEAARGADLAIWKSRFSRPLHHLLKPRPCNALGLTPNTWVDSTGSGPSSVGAAPVHPLTPTGHRVVLMLSAIDPDLQTPFV